MKVGDYGQALHRQVRIKEGRSVRYPPAGCYPRREHEGVPLVVIGREGGGAGRRGETFWRTVTAESIDADDPVVLEVLPRDLEPIPAS